MHYSEVPGQMCCDFLCVSRDLQLCKSTWSMNAYHSPNGLSVQSYMPKVIMDISYITSSRQFALGVDVKISQKLLRRFDVLKN